MVKDTMMAHPVHLHGMFMKLKNKQDDRLLLKHTISVLSGSRVSLLITVDDPRVALPKSSAYNADLDNRVITMAKSVAFNRDETILALLGGPKLVSLTAQDLHTPSALTRLIRRGLPIQSAYFARDHLGVERRLFHTVLPRTTLESARRKKSKDRLTKTTSETLFRMVRIRALAEEAFGEAQRASKWLSTPKHLFDGEAPLSLLDTESGANWVEQVLTRMMYGIDA